jgi:4-amino-4-deoxychorismate lyase
MVNSLKLVDVCSDFDYHLKFADRSALNSLRELRGDCDEILIVKNGYITDTSYSNVVFTDGQHFVAPSTFLLPGTMRASLLNWGLITEATIT